MIFLFGIIVDDSLDCVSALNTAGNNTVFLYNSLSPKHAHASKPDIDIQSQRSQAYLDALTDVYLIGEGSERCAE